MAELYCLQWMTKNINTFIYRDECEPCDKTQDLSSLLNVLVKLLLAEEPLSIKPKEALWACIVFHILEVFYGIKRLKRPWNCRPISSKKSKGTRLLRCLDASKGRKTALSSLLLASSEARRVWKSLPSQYQQPLCRWYSASDLMPKPPAETSTQRL